MFYETRVAMILHDDDDDDVSHWRISFLFLKEVRFQGANYWHEPVGVGARDPSVHGFNRLPGRFHVSFFPFVLGTPLETGLSRET